MSTELNLLPKLEQMLGEAKIPIPLFHWFAGKEEFTQSEVDDLGYMEDKISIWLDSYIKV